MVVAVLVLKDEKKLKGRKTDVEGREDRKVRDE